MRRCSCGACYSCFQSDPDHALSLLPSQALSVMIAWHLHASEDVISRIGILRLHRPSTSTLGSFMLAPKPYSFCIPDKDCMMQALEAVEGAGLLLAYLVRSLLLPHGW